jgi:hypothetical protein
VDLVLELCLSVHVSNETCQAADAVAAHLWLTSIAVEDTHRHVSVTHWWQRKDDLQQVTKHAHRTNQ